MFYAVSKIPAEIERFPDETTYLSYEISFRCAIIPELDEKSCFGSIYFYFKMI